MYKKKGHPDDQKAGGADHIDNDNFNNNRGDGGGGVTRMTGVTGQKEEKKEEGPFQNKPCFNSIKIKYILR